MFNANLYLSDNLTILSALPNDSIDLIYSDILYGTGKTFDDFVDLKPVKSVIYDFYIPRITEMKRILKESGTMYLQMDYRINHWIRDLTDDIFGYENMLDEIIWEYNSAPRKKKQFGHRHDTIFRYVKSESLCTFNEDAVREPYALSAPRGYEKEKYYNPAGKVCGDVWKIGMLGQNDKVERLGYSTQKPLALVDRIVQVSSNPGDLVADFFMGCGTTAESAIKLERNFVGCDISTRAIELTQKRLQKYTCSIIVN